MTFLAPLFARRGIQDPQVPLSSPALVDWLHGGAADAGLPVVTEQTAMGVPAVWRAVSLISGTAASLPLKTYRVGTRTEVPSPLLTSPHPDLTPFELWELAYVHRLLWGNSYHLKIRRPLSQRIAELWPIHPSQTRVGRVRPSEANPAGKVFEVTSEIGPLALTSREVLHIPGLGYDGVCGVSPVRLASQGLALALAAERHGARFFSRGTMLSGVLQTEQRLDSEQAEALAARWRAKRAGIEGAHEVAVLGSGAKYNPISMPNTDAQFLESRSFQVSEVARWFGVPPHMLMDTEKSTSWGTGIEQQGIGFVVYTLRPWLTRTEQRITKTDEQITFRDVYAKYKLQALLRGDSPARAAFYNTMRMVGALSANDIRELEDMPPVEGGDTYLQPLNMGPLGSTAPASDVSLKEPA